MDQPTKTHATLFLVAAMVFSLFGVTAAAAERITHIHTDALGSPVAATDEQGNIIWREKYQPYGERISNAPAASSNKRWYTGHQQDTETGLVYAGARYYDPTIGRFMAVDPVSFTEKNLHSFNRYAYGANNPYKYRDPDGRDIVLAVDPAAAAGNGHTTLYFQNGSGQWYSFNQGAAGYTSSGTGNAGFIMGLNAPAAVDISKIDASQVPFLGNSIWVPTSRIQDEKISRSALRSAEEHNSGSSKYNLYSNNCTDAAVDVVNKSGAGVILPNAWRTIRPNVWIDDAKKWRNDRTFEKELSPMPALNQ